MTEFYVPVVLTLKKPPREHLSLEKLNNGRWRTLCGLEATIILDTESRRALASYPPICCKCRKLMLKRNKNEHRVRTEALRLVELVESGKMSREFLVECVRRYGDAEPALALQILDERYKND